MFNLIFQILQNAIGNSQLASSRKNSGSGQNSRSRRLSQKETFEYGLDNSSTNFIGAKGIAPGDGEDEDVEEEEETENEDEIGSSNVGHANYNNDVHNQTQSSEMEEEEEEIEEEEEEEIIDELNHGADNDSELGEEEDEKEHDEYRMTSNYGRGHINSRFT